MSSFETTKIKDSNGADIAVGQQLAAASVPVVLTAAQITTITPPAAITGFSTSANQTTELSSLSSIDTKLTSQSTAANQSTGNTSLSSIDTKLTSQATAANQTTGNTSLSSIDTKLTSQSTAANQSTANTTLSTINTQQVSDRTAVIDANNTTVANLAAGATFTGTGTDISTYVQIGIEIYGRPGVVAGDGSSAKASFYFEFSKDNSNWDVSVPALIRDPSLVIPIPIIFAHKYFRVKYVNDGGVAAIAALSLPDTAGTATATTTLRITTYLLPSATTGLARTIDQGISGSDPVTVTRSVIMGRNPSLSYSNKAASGVSNSNNSTATLGAGASFTGVFEEITGNSSVVVSIDSDLVGTLVMQFSQDATNIVNPVTRSFTNVSAGQSYIFAPGAKYCRVKYTNTAGTQSFFRLQTIFKSEPVGSIFAPANTPLSENSLAQIVVSVPSDGVKRTYSASVTGLATALLATDIFTITGSASKTVKLESIKLTGTRTASGTVDILLIKRSAANTGGTSAAATAVPHDSSDGAATATVLSYTANPTLGTTVGTMRVEKSFFNSSGTGASDRVIWDFNTGAVKSPTLRGIAEVIAINLNGVTVAGDSIDIYIVFSEE